MQRSKLDHAKSLADHGLSIIPVNAGDKIPCIKWTPYTSRLAREDELKQWFSNFPDRNIGIVTGVVSGVVVVDVDDMDAFTLDMPRTPTARTGKGQHFYFRTPPTGLGNGKLPFGDIKAEGGYVVAPPSKHANGSSYEWIVSFDDAPLADLPASVLALLDKPERVAANDNGEVETTAYGKTWLKDVEAFAKCTAGNRNNQLNVLACKAASLYAGGQLNKFEAWSAMMHASKKNGLWNDKGNGGPRKVDETIRSGWKEGLKNPRYPTESDLIVVDDTPSPGMLSFKAASSLKAVAVPWLWKPVLVKGGMTFLAGEAGQGKSTIAFDIVARITNGDRFPASEDEFFEAGSVVYVSNEDDPNYTIIPRLTAAGANLDKVFIPEGKAVDENGERTFELRSDVNAIEAILERVPDVRLVIIDPFNSYLGKADINDMGQMRSVLNPYAELATKYQVPLLFVHHFNKSSGGKASNRMVGSTALRAAARTVYFVERDPVDEDKRILVCDKNNLAKDLVEYRCTIKLLELGDGIEATYLVWDGDTYRRTSDEVLLDAQNAPAQKKAIALLQALFAEAGTDRLETKAIREACHEAGVHSEVLYKAKEKLGLATVACDTDKRKTLWKLPKAA